MSKTRLDVAMAAQGLAESRQKAQAIIMSRAGLCGRQAGRQVRHPDRRHGGY